MQTWAKTHACQTIYDFSWLFPNNWGTTLTFITLYRPPETALCRLKNFSSCPCIIQAYLKLPRLWDELRHAALVEKMLVWETLLMLQETRSSKTKWWNSNWIPAVNATWSLSLCIRDAWCEHLNLCIYIYFFFKARYAHTQPKSSLSELIKNLTPSSCSHSDIDLFSNKYCRLLFSPIPQQGYTNYQSPIIFVWTVTDSATEHQAFHLCVDVHCAIFQAATNPWVNDGPTRCLNALETKNSNLKGGWRLANFLGWYSRIDIYIYIYVI